MTSRRVAWGLLDQVVSSAANLVVVVLAARSLAPTDFGAFSVGLAICLVVVVVLRGLGSDPLASAHSSDELPLLRKAVAGGLSAVLLASLGVSVLVGALTLALGNLFGSSLFHALLVAALLLPGLVVQDYLRYALIVQRRARSTFLNDLVWGVLQVPLILVAASIWGTPAALLGAWGVAGTACALLGLLQARTLPRGPRAARTWSREHRSLWPWFALDNAVYQATNLGLVLVISLAASLAEVGALRVAMTAYAPLTVIGRGMVGVLVPELARGREDARRVRRRAVMVGTLLSGVTAFWWLLLHFLPDAAGQALFGDTWELARPLFFFVAITIAGGLFMSGLIVGLRALGAAREGMTARALGTVLVLIAASFGAHHDGARGVVITLALLSPVQIGIWWFQLSRTVARITAGKAAVQESGVV